MARISPRTFLSVSVISLIRRLRLINAITTSRELRRPPCTIDPLLLVYRISKRIDNDGSDRSTQLSSLENGLSQLVPPLE